MNRVFYAMILIAFAVAAYKQLADPPVELTEADRTELVAIVDEEGPDAVADWLRSEGEARGVDYVAQIAHSGWFAPSDLDDRLDAAVVELREPTGKATVRALEKVGDFTFGESGAISRFNDGLFSKAKVAVMNVVLPLIGAMAFFLGLMKVAEEAGAMKVIAKLLRPVMARLFPDVPPTHPAMSAMILNMAANALGLGNAATPFGIKAMQELDKLNPSKGTATNAMCLFLAINTSSVTLLPTGVIAIRETLGSTQAAAILPTTLMASILSTITAITAASVYKRFSPFPPPDAAPDGAPPEASGGPDPAEGVDDDPEPDEDAETASALSAEAEDDSYPLWVSGVALLGVLAMIALTLKWGDLIGPWLVPLIVFGFMTFGAVRGVAVYEVFVDGAKEGWNIAVRIVPFLVAILAAVGMLDGSGAIDLFVDAVGPVTSMVGMPAEALPMALLRPLSGSGALGIMVAIMEEYGADTYVGFLVSTLQGSTETTFYTLAVYFGAIGIQRIRHSMAAALTADFMGVCGAVAAVSAYFYFNA